MVASGTIDGPVNAGDRIQLDFQFFAIFRPGTAQVEFARISAIVGGTPVSGEMNNFIPAASGEAIEGFVSTQPFPAGAQANSEWNIVFRVRWDEPTYQSNRTFAGLFPALDVRLLSGGITCIGDYNQDGGVDGPDIQAFFADWETGSDRADLNSDGGVDGGDVQTFFFAWESGC